MYLYIYITLLGCLVFLKLACLRVPHNVIVCEAGNLHFANLLGYGQSPVILNGGPRPAVGHKSVLRN